MLDHPGDPGASAAYREALLENAPLITNLAEQALISDEILKLAFKFKEARDRLSRTAHAWRMDDDAATELVLAIRRHYR